MSKKSIIVLKQTIQVFFISFFVFLATSCEDEPQILGLNLIPDSDKVTAQYIDTFTVYAHTEFLDSIYTGFNSVAPIGNLHDPIFGFTNASLLSEYYPTVASVLGGEFNPLLDSIKLTLYPLGYTGDSVSDMKLNIYTYSDKLPDDSLYSNFVVDEALLEKVGESEYTPNQDAIVMFLNNEFGEKLLSPEGYERDMVYDSLEIFNEVFPALYIESEKKDSKGGINYFRTYTPSDAYGNVSYYSYISLYYHYVENDTTKTNMLRFTFGSRYGAFNNVCLYEHDYEKATFNENSIEQDTVVYLQSLGGTKAVIKIPGLDKLFESNSKISVSSAKLVLPIEDFDKSRHVFQESPYIGISAIDETGAEFSLVDNDYAQSAQSGDVYYVDGSFEEDSLYYELNITNHVESMFKNDNKNLGFNIFSANSSRIYDRQTLYRMVLTNHQNSNPIKLKVIYTKLSN